MVLCVLVLCPPPTIIRTTARIHSLLYPHIITHPEAVCSN